MYTYILLRMYNALAHGPGRNLKIIGCENRPMLVVVPQKGLGSRVTFSFERMGSGAFPKVDT